jgi:hypothetical protein
MGTPVFFGRIRTAVRQEATSEDERGAQSRRSCPLGPDSDGFLMNCLEQLRQSKLERRVAQQLGSWPNTAELLQHRLARRFLFLPF